MTPLLENLLISFLTGIVSSASMIQVVPSNSERDWVMIGSTGVIAFGGSLVNGLRQLHKEAPTKE